MKRKFIKIGICFIALVFFIGSSIILLASDGVTSVTENIFDVNIVKENGIKNLYPGVYADESLVLNENGFWGADVKNAITHEIKVNNAGNLSATVKVIIAFEQGNLTNEEFENLILRNVNETDWTWDKENKVYGLAMDGTKYMAISATYNNELLPNTMTTASLKQILLSKETKNKDIYKIDGNKNGMYDIRIKLLSCEITNNLSEALTVESFKEQTAIEDKTITINYD